MKVEKNTPKTTNEGNIDRSVAMKVIIGVLLLCIGGTAVVLTGMRIFFGTTGNEPTTIAVQIDAPEEVLLNEPFVVTIQVTSLVTTSQILHSIDLDDEYLAGINLSGSAPPFADRQSLPLTSFVSYRYEEEIPAGQTVAVDLQFEGQQAGQFSGLIDICLTDGTLCLAQPLETTIVE